MLNGGVRIDELRLAVLSDGVFLGDDGESAYDRRLTFSWVSRLYCFGIHGFSPTSHAQKYNQYCCRLGHTLHSPYVS